MSMVCDLLQHESTVPENTETHMLLFAELAIILIQNGPLDECQTLFERAIAIHKKKGLRMEPEFLGVYLGLTTCYIALEKWENAVKFGRTTYDVCEKLHGRKHHVTLHAKEVLQVAVSLLKNSKANQKHISLLSRRWAPRHENTWKLGVFGDFPL